jgi:serine/threonine protein kinase
MSNVDSSGESAKDTEVETTLRLERLLQDRIGAAGSTTAPRTTGSPPGELIGRTIKGRFVLESQLGDGGMGVVYKARDLRRAEKDDPNVYVALKLIGESIQSHPEAPLALQREASRALRLAHHNIVHMYDFDRDGDLSFLTMELLSGTSFDALLREHGNGMELARTVPLVRQLCSGLAYAHEQGIIHSDLKPNNVFLTHEGVVKILDFGIATPLRGLNEERPETSFNPRRMGALSPSHACVEMWYGMDADPRDDIYSLGCIVYQLCSGRHPFKGIDAPRAMDAGMTAAPIAGLTRKQNRALATALSFRRQDRTPTVQQFVAEFGLNSVETRSNSGRLVAGVAAAVIAAVSLSGVLYALRAPDRDAPLRPTESKEISTATRGSTQTPVERTSEGAATAASTSASSPPDTFETRCQGAASRESMARLIDQGLAEQTSFTLGSGAEKLESQATMRRIVACLRDLQRLGFSDEASRALIHDAEAIPGLL